MPEVLEQVAERYSIPTSVSSVYASLRPEARSTLTYEQKEFINSLDTFEAPYLQEKLLNDGKFSSPGEYQEAFTEFKKFVLLTQVSRETLGMTSPKVDEVWHQFILFTPEYHGFCEDLLGRYLHHAPKTSYTKGNPNGRKNFERAYQETFSGIPNIWDGDDYCGDKCGGYCDGKCEGKCEVPPE